MNRSVVLLSVFLIQSFLISSVWATAVLQEARRIDENTVELRFDQDVKKDQYKITFMRDIIQIAINNSSVYPAKIFSVSDSDIKKVFAYQYTPKLIRTRLTVDGDAKDYEKRFELKREGNRLIARILPVPTKATVAKKQTDQIKVKNAKNKDPNQPEKKVSDILNKSEKDLLVDVIQKDQAAQAAGPDLGSAMQSLFYLCIFSVIFGIGFFILKKAKFGFGLKGGADGGKVSSWLNRVSNGTLKLKDKVIHVEASHYLGPKKSIVVLRVYDEVLVLGLSNDSINLITKLNSTDDVGQSDFASTLTDSVLGGATKVQEPRPSQASVRDQIRQKIEGMKNL